MGNLSKNELLALDNPRYEEIIRNNDHIEGITIEDITDTKCQLPISAILGEYKFARLKTKKPLNLDAQVDL